MKGSAYALHIHIEMEDARSRPGIDANGLRERLPNKPDAPQQAESLESVQAAVRALNAKEQQEEKEEKEKKTYGRTPDNTGEFSVAPMKDSPCSLVRFASF